MPQLPARPNLIYLRKQARNLFRSLQAGDPGARSRTRGAHPRLSQDTSDNDLDELKLADAQLVLAREHGFDTWAKMKAHIENPTFVAAVEAIQNSDAERLRELIEEDPSIVKIGVSVLDEEFGEGFAGAPLLHYIPGTITSHNHLPENPIELIEILLDAGADLNATTRNGGSMLGLVVSYSLIRKRGLMDEMIDLLVRQGADPNGRSGIRGVGNLECALIHRETEAARSLYRHGANVDLRLAAAIGQLDRMTDFFDAEGAIRPSAWGLAPELEDHDIQVSPDGVLTDALSLAAINRQFDAIDFLLARGADLNAYSNWVVCPGVTPLHCACWLPGPEGGGRRGPEMVAFLLDRGADPMIRNPGDPNATPFQWSIHNGNHEIVAYMLQRGEGVGDLQDHLGHAVQQGYIEVVRALMQAGADPLDKCRGDKNAIQVAEEANREAMLSFLKEARP